MEFEPAPPLPPFIQALLPAGLERFRVPVTCQGRTLSMHVMAIGSGRPVVLVHGNPTWGFLYRQVIAALAGADGQPRGMRLIIPDLIGLGLSDHPNDAGFHTLDNHGEALRSCLDALGLGGLVLVVQDWGGPIGIRALVDTPERLEGLVVLNTVLAPPKPGFKPTRFHRFARMPVVSDLAFRVLGYPQRALWLAQGDRNSIRGDVSRAYQWPLRGQPVAPLALARMVPDSLDHPSVPALRRCEALVTSRVVPTAIVWGDRDPVLGRVVHRITKMLPHAEVTRTQAGHFLQEEVPETIAAAIRRVVLTLPPRD